MRKAVARSLSQVPCRTPWLVFQEIQQGEDITVGLYFNFGVTDGLGLQISPVFSLSPAMLSALCEQSFQCLLEALSSTGF